MLAASNGLKEIVSMLLAAEEIGINTKDKVSLCNFTSGIFDVLCVDWIVCRYIVVLYGLILYFYRVAGLHIC